MMKKPTESGKIVKNATWLIACKVVQSLLSFVIGTLSARYLGPGNYGIIDYAAAIVSFMVPVVQLGLRSTLVHEIIEKCHLLRCIFQRLTVKERRSEHRFL